ncbi:SDR family oxidoreductase [Novosphingobium sp. FSY-8]|uniref:SDR family oxidoreductase n=1 Tax=Novosphingobium ovatum TaxID=1908523 RepID=A0ABW9XB76_9SPHN|nr:SDR family oxidoreductase [Novosphingobium ovatum]NBC35780.1 SDR family oxidoreductase [Novosphingobium ovatum]
MTRPSVLITGGAKRIGAHLARAFGDAGWHVVIHYGQSRDAAQALAASLPSAEIARCDLADGDAAVEMAHALAQRLDDWRVLINCAAVFRYDGAAGIDPSVMAEAMAVNAITPTRLAQAFLAPADQGGAQSRGGRRVINLLDMKLANPNPDFFSYTMAKHALGATVRMLAMAAQDGGARRPDDRVYGLAPGAMLPSWDQAPHEHQTSGRMNLLGRLTELDDLASTALFLSQGWLASGETVFVDSGQHLLSQPRDVLYLARS